MFFLSNHGYLHSTALSSVLFALSLLQKFKKMNRVTPCVVTCERRVVNAADLRSERPVLALQASALEMQAWSGCDEGGRGGKTGWLSWRT